MTVCRRSEALSVGIDNPWFADSGATEHVTERREWFSTFKLIPSGWWSGAVADDKDFWVRGVGNIKIVRTIDGEKKPWLLKQILFIPELKRNSFSISLAVKAGLSFCTIGDCLYHDFGKGPKVMEGVRMDALYKLSIEVVLPSGIPDTIPSS